MGPSDLTPAGTVTAHDRHPPSAALIRKASRPRSLAVVSILLKSIAPSGSTGANVTPSRSCDGVAFAPVELDGPVDVAEIDRPTGERGFDSVRISAQAADVDHGA